METGVGSECMGGGGGGVVSTLRKELHGGGQSFWGFFVFVFFCSIVCHLLIYPNHRAYV